MDDKDVQKYLQNVSRGIEERDEPKFDPNTGQLKAVPVSKHTPDPGYDMNKYIEVKMAAKGFFGGCFIVYPEKDTIVIIPGSGDKARVCVSTMHISCKSDTYEPGHNYGGVIIYQYDGKSEWRTANNTHCKSGYIVIQDTDSEAVKKWGNEPGQVHGAIYRNAFGESVKEKEVVGEGFALRRDEKLEIKSGVFNNPKGSAFHDHLKQMHELSEHCIGKIVKYWKTAGPRWVTRQRNFEIKQLLEDFEFKAIHSHCEY